MLRPVVDVALDAVAPVAVDVLAEAVAVPEPVLLSALLPDVVALEVPLESAPLVGAVAAVGAAPELAADALALPADAGGKVAFAVPVLLAPEAATVGVDAGGEPGIVPAPASVATAGADAPETPA